MKPSEQRDAAAIQATLARLARYDDESIVHDRWIRQRYEGRYAASYMPARAAAVSTAWHEAGHAVAALAVGARFSSASILHGRDSAGRVHRISGGGDLTFVIDAAGQIAERLRDWSMPGSDGELRAWLARWTRDGGDARYFRRDIVARFGPADDAADGAAGCAAWRYSEQVLTPLRPAIRQVARALLVHPQPLPCPVTSVIAGPCRVPGGMSDPPATMGSGT
ncbi:MAG: hypothetical protein ABSF03_16080 [Streptosporangiaceae bacterium]